MADIKLIVGLGNPGSKYEKTRHNLGFMLLDLLAEKAKVTFSSGRGKWDQVRMNIDNNDIWAVKPMTYMNLSGHAVQQFASYYKFEPEQILVVCDDINLPAGKLRIRSEGSAGGHRGLENIIEMLGSDRFARIRLGLGMPPPGIPSEDFVLRSVAESEKKIILALLKTAAEAVGEILSNGIAAAQNKYN